MRKEYTIDFQGSATVYAESEDEAMDLFYDEDWDDFIVDRAFIYTDDEDEGDEE